MEVVLEFKWVGIRVGIKILSRTSVNNGTFSFSVPLEPNEKVSSLFLQHLEAKSLTSGDPDYGKYLNELKTYNEIKERIV